MQLRLVLPILALLLASVTAASETAKVTRVVEGDTLL